MNFRTVFLPLTMLLSLSSFAQAAESAEELFDAKCLSCHIKTMPTDFNTLVGPPLFGVMKHVKMKHETKVEAVNFITSYTLNPQRDSATCTPKTIKKFGLMPSQKDSVTEDELRKIASWAYDNFPPANYNKGKTCNSNGCGSKSCGNKKNKSANKQQSKKFKPFLITSKGMPHFTKMVKQNWDNQTFNLSGEQKKKLLVVRKNTMKSVMGLSPQIKQLEQQIKKSTMKGEIPNEIFPMVEKLAKLKAEATKAHISCIYNTKKILTKQQVKFLINR